MKSGVLLDVVFVQATTDSAETIGCLSCHPSHISSPNVACESDRNLSVVTATTAMGVVVYSKTKDTISYGVLPPYTENIHRGWMPKHAVNFTSPPQGVLLMESRGFYLLPNSTPL